jgi:hypothetical protein
MSALTWWLESMKVANQKSKIWTNRLVYLWWTVSDNRQHRRSNQNLIYSQLLSIYWWHILSWFEYFHNGTLYKQVLSNNNNNNNRKNYSLAPQITTHFANSPLNTPTPAYQTTKSFEKSPIWRNISILPLPRVIFQLKTKKLINFF